MTTMEANPFTVGGGGGYPIPNMQSQGPQKFGSQMDMQSQQFQGDMQSQQGMSQMGGAPQMPSNVQSGWLPGVSRPQMTQVSNPPVVSHNIQYGPSYSMNYTKRSTADKTAVKYTGFLPLEGVYEEDTCRIG